MRLILLGAPGVGKGTQGMKLAEFYGIPKLSTGEILRNAIASGSKLGLEVAAIMNQGMLVSDAIVEEIVAEKLQNDPICHQGFILDGFPRTLPQAKALTEILKSLPHDKIAVVNISMEQGELVQRLANRLTCSDCGYTFNMSTMQGQAQCAKCGSINCVQRPDDSEEAVTKRMKVYDDLTKPVIGYYRGQDGWIEVDGRGDIESVFNNIISSLRIK